MIFWRLDYEEDEEEAEQVIGKGARSLRSRETGSDRQSMPDLQSDLVTMAREKAVAVKQAPSHADHPPRTSRCTPPRAAGHPCCRNFGEGVATSEREPAWQQSCI